MMIELITCFRNILGANLNVGPDLVLGWPIFGGLIFIGNLVLVSRGLIYGGLYSRGLIFEILRYYQNHVNTSVQGLIECSNNANFHFFTIQWNLSTADMLYSRHLSIAHTLLENQIAFSIEIYLFIADTSL